MVGVGAVLQQGHHTQLVAFLSRYTQGRGTLVARVVREGAVFQQQFHYVAVTLPTRRMEGCAVFEVTRVDLALAVGQKEGDHLGVALPCRDVQRRPTLVNTTIGKTDYKINEF